MWLCHHMRDPQAPLLTSGVPYVSTAKGIHVATHALMSEAIPKALGEHKHRVPLAYLSGQSNRCLNLTDTCHFDGGCLSSFVTQTAGEGRRGPVQFAPLFGREMACHTMFDGGFLSN